MSTLNELIKQIRKLQIEINYLNRKINECEDEKRKLEPKRERIKIIGTCKTKGTQWKDNSCVYDSVLLALLYPENEYIYNKMFYELPINRYESNSEKLNNLRRNLDDSLYEIMKSIKRPKITETCINFWTYLYKINQLSEELIGYKPSKLTPVRFEGEAIRSPTNIFTAICNEYHLCLPFHISMVSNINELIEKLKVIYLNEGLERFRDFINDKLRPNMVQVLKEKINNLYKLLYGLLVNKILVIRLKQRCDKFESFKEYVTSKKVFEIELRQVQIFINIYCRKVNNIFEENTNKYNELITSTKLNQICTLAKGENRKDKLFLHGIVYTCSEGHKCAMIKCGNDWYNYDGMRHKYRNSFIKISEREVIRKMLFAWENDNFDIWGIYWDKDEFTT